MIDRRTALARAFKRRGRAITSITTAWRLCDGPGDDLPGVYVDRYGPAAIFSVYDDAGLSDEDVTALATQMLDLLRPAGVTAVYVKPFTKDRSRLGGTPPAETTAAVPRAGVPLSEVLIVDEYGVRFETRPYDGFSTGLFLEHRDHRRALSQRSASRALNLFAYTCGFSVPLALAGVEVTNVDVSTRYLDWGRRNHALNGADPSRVRYVRMDAMAYLAYCRRHPEERFDLIVIDPPTFAAADRRRGIKPWKATSDYPAMLHAACSVLTKGGAVFASTNARTLAEDGALRQLVSTAVGRVRWLDLPPWPADVRERGRVAAVFFSPR